MLLTLVSLATVVTWSLEYWLLRLSRDSNQNNGHGARKRVLSAVLQENCTLLIKL